LLSFAQGDIVTARRLCIESLALWREIGHPVMMSFCLENLAAMVVVQGQLILGVHVWGAVEMMREVLGIPPTPPAMRLFYEQAMATARAQLGQEAFAAAWAEGRATPLDQVISNVLKMDG
jgi:hypothetical protein